MFVLLAQSHVVQAMGHFPANNYSHHCLLELSIILAFWFFTNFATCWINFFSNSFLFQSTGSGCTTALIRVFAALGLATDLRTMTSEACKLGLTRSVDSGRSLIDCLTDASNETMERLPNNHFLNKDKFFWSHFSFRNLKKINLFQTNNSCFSNSKQILSKMRGNKFYERKRVK